MTVIFVGYHQATLPVAAEVKARGHRTAIVETEGGFPAVLPEYLSPYADVFDTSVTVAGWGDVEALTEAIRNGVIGPLTGVYTQLDEASVVAATLRIAAGLPTTSPNAVVRLINKLWVRQELVRRGLSRLRVVEGRELDELTTWPFPGRRGFVKNVVGAGGYGVRGVGDMRDLRAALASLGLGLADTSSLSAVMRASRHRMLEEAADGVLVSFEGIVTSSRVLSLGFTRPHRLETDLGGRDPRPMPGCIHPHPFVGDEEAAAFLADAVVALGYTDGPIHVEAMLTPDGRCEIIDLNPRFAGAHCLWAMNAARSDPVEKLLADWTLGRPAPAAVSGHTAVACLQYFLAPVGEKTLDSVTLPEAPKAVWAAPLKRCGVELPADPADGGWVGGYIVREATGAKATEVSRKLRESVKVNGRDDVIF
jgi:hypothetical protein